MARTSDFSRTAVRAFALSLALGFVLLLLAVALTLLAQPKGHVTGVDVVDDTSDGVVDGTLLKRQIGALRVYEPTRVVVWARDGQRSDNINAKTLEWAREHPDMRLLSADGNYWADSTLIITVSVESNSGTGHGQVGTYFGENIKVEPTDKQKKLQEKGYQSFNERNWSAGVLAVAQASAKVMARPDMAAPAVTMGLPVVVIVLLVVNGGLVLMMRTRYQAARASFDATTEGVNDRVSATEFILDEGFGSKIRATAASVLREYDDTLTLRNAIDSTPLLAVWSVNMGLWSKLGRFKGNGADIADASNMLDRANRLYARDSSWEQVWEDEVAETRRAFATDGQSGADRVGNAAWTEFEAFRREALEKLEDIRSRGIAGGGENLSQCLEEISELRRELSTRTAQLENLAMPANDKEAGYIARAIDKDRRRVNRGYRSINGYYDRGSFYTPMVFFTGYSAGHSNYVSAQQSSSSGGSTTGFGGGGGGFSGSGSSSGF